MSASSCAASRFSRVTLKKRQPITPATAKQNTIAAIRSRSMRLNGFFCFIFLSPLFKPPRSEDGVWGLVPKQVWAAAHRHPKIAERFKTQSGSEAFPDNTPFQSQTYFFIVQHALPFWQEKRRCRHALSVPSGQLFQRESQDIFKLSSACLSCLPSGKRTEGLRGRTAAPCLILDYASFLLRQSIKPIAAAHASISMPTQP